ncbi:hypothetical protein [Soonwooa sp.]|uniref:hypothetical protein n=1 Tax=Soonwooa sp. TaxID=1938592 RepID=UPI00261A9BE1|nr:hypothetical protein [Soonwooa sp.]
MIKKQLLILSVLFSFLVFSQDKTLYFDGNWKETTKSKAYYYRKLPLPKLANLELLRDYYSDTDKLQMQGYYADAVDQNYVGDIYWYSSDGTSYSSESYINKSKQKKLSYYFDNGNLWKTIEYGDSLKHGKTIEYKIDGSILGEAIYKNGSLISGTIGNSSLPNTYYYRYNKKTKNNEHIDIQKSEEAPQLTTRITYWKNTLKTAVEYQVFDGKTISEKNYDENGNLLQSLDSLSYYYPSRQLKNGRTYYYANTKSYIENSPTFIEYKSFPFSEVETRNISHIIIYRGTLHFLEKHPSLDKYRETDYNIFSDNNTKFMRLTWNNYSNSVWKEMKEYLDSETKLIPVSEILNLNKEQIYKRFANKKWKSKPTIDKNVTEELYFDSPEFMAKNISAKLASENIKKESALIYFKIANDKYIMMRENGGFFIPRNNGDRIEIPNFVQE